MAEGILSDFSAFFALAEPRLRRAFVAAYGGERGREAAAEALAWAWEHWSEVEAMDNPIGYLYRVGRSRTRGRRHRVVFVRADGAEPWVEPRLGEALAGADRTPAPRGRARARLRLDPARGRRRVRAAGHDGAEPSRAWARPACARSWGCRKMSDLGDELRATIEGAATPVTFDELAARDGARHGIGGAAPLAHVRRRCRGDRVVIVGAVVVINLGDDNPPTTRIAAPTVVVGDIDLAVLSTSFDADGARDRSTRRSSTPSARSPGLPARRARCSASSTWCDPTRR